MIIKNLWKPQPNNNPISFFALASLLSDHASVYTLNYDAPDIVNNTMLVPFESCIGVAHGPFSSGGYQVYGYADGVSSGLVKYCANYTVELTGGIPTTKTLLSKYLQFQSYSGSTQSNYYGSLIPYATALSSAGGHFVLWKPKNATVTPAGLNSLYPASWAGLNGNTGGVTTSNYPQGRTEFGQLDSQASFNPSSTLLSYSFSSTFTTSNADTVRITGSTTSGSTYSGKECGLVKWLDDTTLLVGYYDGTNTSFDVWDNTGTRVATNVMNITASPESSGYTYIGYTLCSVSSSKLVLCERSTGKLYLINRSGNTFSILDTTAILDDLVPTNITARPKTVFNLSTNKIMSFAPVSISRSLKSQYIKFDVSGSSFVQSTTELPDYLYPVNAVQAGYDVATGRLITVNVLRLYGNVNGSASYLANSYLISNPVNVSTVLAHQMYYNGPTNNNSQYQYYYMLSGHIG